MICNQTEVEIPRNHRIIMLECICRVGRSRLERLLKYLRHLLHAFVAASLSTRQVHIEEAERSQPHTQAHTHRALQAKTEQILSRCTRT